MITSRVERTALRVNPVQIIDDMPVPGLSDGRVISAPLVRYPRLLQGSTEERNRREMIGGGEGIHRPLLDEDLRVESVLDGRPSAESAWSLRQWLSAREAATHSAV